MEPFLLIMVPGVLGGVLVALLIVRFSRASERVTDDGRLQPPSTNMINMASIRVSGLGGLGMVAMAVTVAIFVPRIRLTMAIALLLGGGLAAALIAFRRRSGPLPSGTHPGAHSMLPLEDEASDVSGDDRPRGRTTRELSAAPARL
jgi:hypothetical protein